MGSDGSADESRGRHRPAPAAQPRTPLDNATFAAGGEDVGRSLRPPLPMSAQGRVLYQVPHMNTPTPSLPGLYRSSTPIAAWFASLSASSGGGPTNIGSIGALALDREVAFPAIEVSRDVVERARAGTRSPSPDFPVIARVLLDVERVDVVKLLANYGGRDGQPLNRGALIARVAGLQVLSATGELIASLD